MTNDIIKRVKGFVESECKNPGSKYGYEPFPYHFVPMVKRAEKLSEQLGGDKEVILIASWLHDIGSIAHGRKDHHITGAKIAEEKLKEFGYSTRKTELIKKCILNHRGSKQNERKTIEEKIIAEADTLSNFDNVAGVFKAAYIYENLTQGEARKSVMEKFKRKWQQLHFENSKKIIKPKYEAILLLLR